MRQTAGRLNRTWLVIIGLVALILGVAGLLLASGVAKSVIQSLGGGVTAPQPEDPALPAGFQSVFAPDSAAIILTVIAVLVGVCALLWLLAQIPRRNRVGTFRLHEDNAVDGYTRCETKVLGEAVEKETERLHGVNAVGVLLRGSSTDAELTLDVKVDDRADVQDIVRRISSEVAPNLEAALEAPLRKIAVLLNVSPHRSKDRAAVL